MADRSAAASEAFAKGDWAVAHRLLAGASGVSGASGPATGAELTATDLDRLATSAYLIGKDDEAVAAWEQAHRRHVDEGELAEAALCAFWAAFCLMMQGQMAHAGGWLERCRSVIGDLDCPAAGYLLVPAVVGALESGEAGAARELAMQAGEIAERFSDRDLGAFATLGHGQALLALGEEGPGLARFDEVMLSVSSGQVGPITTGIVYCAVILECMQIFDLARASEWTRALDEWCAAHPDLVPYRGQCLVHQSQLQQAAGDWSEAVSTVASACDRLTDPPHPALGLACYQEAELHRLRGELDAAARAYGRASRAGYHPMPGLALLERARGDVEAAAASIRRVLSEAGPPFQRPPLLAAGVEIYVAAGDLAAASEAADELVAIAARSRSQVLGAMAEQATGSVLLASGELSDALVHLRAASEVWQRLHMPYERARAAVLLGRGCLALGDRASAGLELDIAGETFASLGALPDLADLEALTGDVGLAAGVLSKREREVLARVAEGMTNREIAEALSISQHTVARHLENIFAKLGVSGRAAATAYAYEHNLL